MSIQKSSIVVFVLTKNEAPNIGKCLDALRSTSWPVVVLDSGSADDTESIVSGFGFAEFRNYQYVDHCKAYNDITTTLSVDHRYVVILDADMVITPALQNEINEIVNSSSVVDVLEAEIIMCSDGLPLKYGSLCPPKACMFKAGKSFFVNSGHAEKLRHGTIVIRANEKLIHDDRKSYATFLQSQLRYSKNLAVRSAVKQISFRDWVRTKTPLLILAVPFVSFFIRRGFLSGRAGGLYALDRLIAEAIMYRQALSRKLDDM